MSHFDVFNGDADGLCALQQLRLTQPREGATLITGVKRDISLLKRLSATAGDTVTVLDISLDKNRDALLALLDNGVDVEYYDHHFAGDIPSHPQLHTHIDTSPATCTSLIVNAVLDGQHRAWAVAGAFGDNFHDAARHCAEPLGLSESELDSLCELGTCLNYNGYGQALEDLFFHPAEMAEYMRPYADPFQFIEKESAYRTLLDGYRTDMANAENLAPEFADEKVALFILPDAPWARRVSGVYGNLLARQAPDRAHAILTLVDNGAYRVSVRAPLSTKQGADTLCMAFPSGGGRQAAAGINELPAADYDRFITLFRESFS
jgi:hypothetical protein